MRNIKINNKDYAIGFWWQILDGKGAKKQLFEKARKLSEDFKDRNYNCVVPRKQQFGLGSCTSGKIKRRPSLACALVERSQPTWIGMFCLSGQKDIWWICAVSKKTIVAEGDQFFNSRAEAQAHLKSLKSMSDWDGHEITCETLEESLAHFEGLIKPKEKVQSLIPENPRGKIIAVAAVVVLLGMGWILWNSHQNSILEEQRRIAALEARLKQKKQQVNIEKDPAQLFSMGWKDAPLPSAFADEFINAVHHTDPFKNGWKLESIVRTDEGIYMSWLHQTGARFTDRPYNSTLGSGPKLAEITINYPRAEKRQSQSLIKKDDATAQLYELTRNIGAKLTLNWQAPEVKKLNNRIIKEAAEITAPWVVGKWKLSGLSAVVTLSNDLFFSMDTIPCLVVSEISLTNNQCSMEGRIYASY
ncbi:type 4b pilus protein PilO2 [Maridesulfovibrio hydrothermalis]|uniref:Pilin accessory protein (PilO) n=1 Tax=Maridesulfovibrio hydrothermalis AM13 = DSM 14728 TaxID=1121451 RepID=L0RB61_9BACT|nr:type 4b pilus protein PilO2 [Maridesulfovibrio hydrothermalis]CCO24023.1 conserved protein of unknown function [Maridesulfovibrio hydrothermalis AM13 = DSM 14728]